MSKWRLWKAIGTMVVATLTFFGFEVPNWKLALNWLTSVDLWIINNAAYPSLFALAVGFLLGTVIIPEAWGLFRKQFERDPKLKILFDKDEAGCVHETGFSGTTIRCTFVRVLPTCEARINNCSGFLTGVFRWNAGTWEATQFDERLPLKWGSIDSPQVSLHPSAKQYLDVFHVADEDNKIRLVTPDQRVPKRAFNTFDDSKAVYRIDIAVMGDKDAYATISLRVHTTDDWKDPSINVIEPETRRRWWQLKKA